MTARDPVVAVIGSRNYQPLDHARAFIRRLHLKYPAATVVSGGATGVDQAAETEADTLGLGVISYRPHQTNDHTIVEVVVNERARYLLGETAVDYCQVLAQGTWPLYNDALKARNTMIVDASDHVVAFWTRWSRGTLHVINYAHTCKKPVHINPITD